VGAGIAKPFSTGTVLDLSFAGHRSVSRAAELDATLGPAYSIASRLTLTQPLLRGAGSEVGLTSLRQARLRRTATTLARDSTASSLLSSVLRAYWELWYADQVVRINEASLALAREQTRQAELQVQSGALAEIDVLTYQTRRAELEEAAVLAATERTQRSLALAVLLAAPSASSAELSTADSPPKVVLGSPDAASALADAERSSPELAQLRTQIAIARDQLEITGDPLRPRLDLEAYVEVQGLGNREAPPAFEQAGRFEAVGAHVGLTFEAPLDGTRRHAQIASARLSQHVAEKQLEVARQRLESDVLSAIAARAAAQRRVQVATETVRVASSQAQAERNRFSTGTSIALSVREAEDSLRQAQLRLERARVDSTLAEVELLFLRGRLLERYRSVLSRLAPRAPSLENLTRTPL
jgi:outer membrane protein TolC